MSLVVVSYNLLSMRDEVYSQYQDSNAKVTTSEGHICTVISVSVPSIIRVVDISKNSV